MATLVGCIATSHTPTIGFALDTHKQADPVWAPIFAAYKPVQEWLAAKRPDVLVFIYNDHVTSFFLDHYPQFALGVGREYFPADEGGGARKLPPIPGHPRLAQHLAQGLVADEFDLSYIFVAHDLGVVRHVSDRIAVMYLGKVVERSPGSQLYERPIHPYSVALLSAVPIPDQSAYVTDTGIWRTTSASSQMDRAYPPSTNALQPTSWNPPARGRAAVAATSDAIASNSSPNAVHIVTILNFLPIPRPQNTLFFRICSYIADTHSCYWK